MVKGYDVNFRQYERFYMLDYITLKMELFSLPLLFYHNLNDNLDVK